MAGRWPAPGRRVVIWGPSGAGKTTLARSLGQRLDLAVIGIDALFHCRPNWQHASAEELRASVAAALGANPTGWVCDGNYSAVADLVLG